MQFFSFLKSNKFIRSQCFMSSDHRTVNIWRQGKVDSSLSLLIRIKIVKLFVYVVPQLKLFQYAPYPIHVLKGFQSSITFRICPKQIEIKKIYNLKEMFKQNVVYYLSAFKNALSSAQKTKLQLYIITTEKSD